MNNGKRIITPGEFANRQDRRASLAEVNKMLVRETKRLESVVHQQAASIQAMNKVFTDIAEAIGTPVPKTAAEGVNALTALLIRIKELVENEEHMKQTAMERTE